MVSNPFLNHVKQVFKYESPSRIIFVLLNVFFMIGLGIITVVPFLHMFAGSLSDPALLLQGRISIFPQAPHLEAYRAVLRHPLLITAYQNTVMYTVFGTVLNITLTIMGAYALSRSRFFGKKFFMFFIVLTMIFQGGLIPTFLIVRWLGLLDTRLAMILPSAVNAFNLIVLRSFFLQQPREIEESAIIDGANELQIMFRIVVPLAIPGILTVTMFYAVDHWNRFFDALIYLRDRGLIPMQIVLREVVIESNVDQLAESAGVFDLLTENIKYATIVVATVPILIVYPFIQKHFIKGVMIGSLKG